MTAIFCGNTDGPIIFPNGNKARMFPNSEKIIFPLVFQKQEENKIKDK